MTSTEGSAALTGLNGGSDYTRQQLGRTPAHTGARLAVSRTTTCPVCSVRAYCLMFADVRVGGRITFFLPLFDVGMRMLECSVGDFVIWSLSDCVFLINMIVTTVSY